MSERDAFEYEKLKMFHHEAARHAQRLEAARERVAKILPLNTERYETLGLDEIEHIDWLHYRFTKLQDTMGRKLFPQIMVLYELDEEWAYRPMRDLLNRLEKVGFIERAEIWDELRKVRNLIAHEYETDNMKAIASIESLYRHSETLLRIFEQCHHKMERERML